MTGLRNHWRARRDLILRRLDERLRQAVARYLLNAAVVEMVVAREFKKRDEEAKHRAWFEQQHARLAAERDYRSDPRRLLVRRLEVIQNEPNIEKRLAVGGGALAQYVDDPEVIELWRSLA